MICHHRPCIDRCPCLVGKVFHSLHKTGSIDLVIHDASLLYSPYNDMMQCSGGIQPRLPWHVCQTSSLFFQIAIAINRLPHFVTLVNNVPHPASEKSTIRVKRQGSSMALPFSFAFNMQISTINHLLSSGHTQQINFQSKN